MSRAAALLVALAAGAQTQDAPSPEAFAAGVAQARRQAAEGRFERARDALLALLEEHAHSEHALFHLPTILAELERCAFELAHGEIDPAELVRGELLRWDARRGRIHLRYTREHIEEREVEPEDRSVDLREDSERGAAETGLSLEPRIGRASPAAPASTLSIGDFTQSATLLRHPLHFVGPFSVTVRGRMPAGGADGPYLSAHGRGTTTSVYADFGCAATEGAAGRPARLADLSRSSEPAATADSPLRPGPSYEVRFEIGSRGAAMFVGRRKLLGARLAALPEDCFLRPSHHIEEIEIEGTCSGGWIAALVGARRDELYGSFESRHDARALLPPALRERLAQLEARVEPDWPMPCEVPEELRECARELLPRVGSRAGAAALAALAALPRVPGDEDLRRWAAALRAAVDGRWSEVGEALDGLREPRAAAARHLRARALAGAGESARALELLRGLHRELPASACVAEELARALVRGRRHDEAREVLRAALAAGAPLLPLAELHRVLLRAAAGPASGPRLRAEGRHYVVESAVEARAGKVVAEQIEAALRVVAARFEGLVPMHRDAGFLRAYVFATRAEARRYAGTVGGRHHAPLGYFPELDQILFPAESTRGWVHVAVLRSEVARAVLRARAPGLPRWLETGLADHLALSELEGRTLIPPRNLLAARALARPELGELAPWERVLDAGAEAPSAGAAELQVWAVVDFLMSRAAPRVERALARALEGADAAAVQRELLGGMGAGDLGARALDHAAALLEEPPR